MTARTKMIEAPGGPVPPFTLGIPGPPGVVQGHRVNQSDGMTATSDPSLSHPNWRVLGLAGCAARA